MVEADDAGRLADEPLLHVAGTAERPVRLLAEEAVDLVEIDPLLRVVELEPVAELAPHADSVRRRKPPCSSYDATITMSASRARAVRERGPDRVRERRREQALDRGEALGREAQPVDGVRPTERSA